MFDFQRKNEVKLYQLQIISMDFFYYGFFPQIGSAYRYS